MTLCVLLPFTIIFLQIILLYNLKYKNLTYLSWRRSVITSILLYSLWVALITELLSILNAITFIGFISSYLIYFVVVFYVFIKNFRKSNIFLHPFKKPRLPVLDYIIISVSLVLILYLLLIAVVSPPNNWDSMTYHLPRVMHWLQNKNLNYYSTHHEFQNIFPPLAEYFILHWQGLTGNDYFSQVVQFLFMIGSCIAIALIVEKLGGKRKAQVWSFFLTITLPMGIYQSVSTQNDYVNSFFVIISVYYLLEILEKNRGIYYYLFAIAVGLALKTKSTAYIFEFVPCIICVIVLIKKNVLKNSFLISLGIILLIIFINGGNYFRNLQFYNNPFGLSVAKYEPANSILSWKPVYSNSIKYIGYQLQTGYYLWDEFILNNVNGFHRILNMDIGDPSISMKAAYIVPAGSLLYSEDYVSNPIQVFVFLIAIIFIFFYYKKFNTNIFLYLLIIFSGFLLFCLYLKWWEFNNRLILPIIILTTGFSGIFIEIVLSKINGYHLKNILPLSLFTVISIYTVNKLIYSFNKPILTNKNIFNTAREDLYFIDRSNLKDNYFKAITSIKNNNCKLIGLVNEKDDWEYPFWILLKKENPDVRIESVNVKNKSAEELKFFKYCTTIEFDNSKNMVEVRNKVD